MNQKESTQYKQFKVLTYTETIFIVILLYLAFVSSSCDLVSSHPDSAGRIIADSITHLISVTALFRQTHLETSLSKLLFDIYRSPQVS